MIRKNEEDEIGGGFGVGIGPSKLLIGVALIASRTLCLIVINMKKEISKSEFNQLRNILSIVLLGLYFLGAIFKLGLWFYISLSIVWYSGGLYLLCKVFQYKGYSREILACKILLPIIMIVATIVMFVFYTR